ncbi:hypothetical protein HK104_007899 [Borealophlyctis nickersoniae]|nr:hypothetical protein HK104_007899 [Borealophlyctis nickersoniae]
MPRPATYSLELDFVNYGQKENDSGIGYHGNVNGSDHLNGRERGNERANALESSSGNMHPQNVNYYSNYHPVEGHNRSESYGNPNTNKNYGSDSPTTYYQPSPISPTPAYSPNTPPGHTHRPRPSPSPLGDPSGNSPYRHSGYASSEESTTSTAVRSTSSWSNNFGHRRGSTQDHIDTSLDSQFSPNSTFVSNTSRDNLSISSDSDRSDTTYRTYGLNARHIYKVARTRGWFDNADVGCVAIRYAPGKCVVFPEPNDKARRTAEALNAEAIIFFSTDVIETAIDLASSEGRRDLLLQPEKEGGPTTKLQLIPSLDRLPRARKHQWAALLQQEKVLAVWADHTDTLLDDAAVLEKRIMTTVRNWNGTFQVMDVEGDVEADGATGVSAKRGYSYIAPVMNSLAFCLSLLTGGLLIRTLLMEIAADGNWVKHMPYAASLIILLPMTMYFPQVLLLCVALILGPISQIERNTMFYSGIRPKRLKGPLPHITVQIPVYLEGLDAVIKPTIESVKRAITTYERQGGSCNIFVCDDGMQVLPEKEAQRRREYYANNSIGWVGRPKHNSEDGFVRRGRFKKASNLNFALQFSMKVDDAMNAIDPMRRLNPEQEGQVYTDILEDVLEQDGRAWAEGDIRVGEIILILDSDSRIPEDCMLDAASEMAESPEVAILQHTASAMIVGGGFWESGMAHFTKIIYLAIRYACATGDIAPFVGHNAFLRWGAIKQVAFEEDSEIKFWSESHVSEDFDMALRLQIQGYVVRYASYSNGQFQEGVSLTVYDEITRFRKYAYGCAELLFNPLSKWITRGPFTKLFRTFLFSNVPLWGKLSICAYIFNYYTLGAAWLLTLINYIAWGWFPDDVDHFLLANFEIFISVTFLFGITSPIINAVYRYRSGTSTLLYALYDNLKWVLFYTLFFSAISMHVSFVLLGYFVGYNVRFGVTSKEVENESFFVSLGKIIRNYWPMYLLSLPITAGILFLYQWSNVDWNIPSTVMIVAPLVMFLSHILAPILLNPSTTAVVSQAVQAD